MRNVHDLLILRGRKYFSKTEAIDINVNHACFLSFSFSFSFFLCEAPRVIVIIFTLLQDRT
jgi:hypothetical protein